MTKQESSVKKKVSDKHKLKSFPFRMSTENREKLERYVSSDIENKKTKTEVINRALKHYLENALQRKQA